MAKKCEFRKKNARGAAPTPRPAIVSASHDPDKASEGRRARRAGGITRSRSAAVLPSDTPDHPLGNTQEVSAFLADSIHQLRRGELDPRVANGMGYLTSVLLRSLEQGPVEERLSKIEAALAANARPAKGASIP